MKKALIRTGYSCNNKCIFCHLGCGEKSDLTAGEIKIKILFCKKQGYNFIVLTGGEPTIRKDIVDIAKFVKQNKMDFGVITNGRMFSYDSFVKKLVQNNLKYVYVSLLGSTEGTHNEIINSDGFKQTTRGIRNLAKCSTIELKVNVSVLSKNIDDLKNIVDLAKKIGVKKLKFSSTDYKGNVLKNIKMVPKLSLTIEKIKESVDYAIEKGVQPYVSDLPLCLIDKYEKYVDNLETNNIEVMSEVFEEELFPIDSDDKTKSSSCVGCVRYKRCKGIDREYLKRNGDEEMVQARKVGNSVLYVLKEKLEKVDCKNIPKDAYTILVENKIYVSNSDNFSEDQINLLKDKEQVYLVSGDYTKHNLLRLTKLKQNLKCNKCNIQNNCSRMFVIQGDEPFKKYLDSVENELRNLKGKVLDVGCGDIYFKEVFSMLIEKNVINYLGIDQEKIQNTKYKIINSKFEDYEFQTELFDNMLLLGSYNHILNTDLLLRKIKRHLKKNGLLIISDSEPYIILREGESNESKKEFEHYRNAYSGEVVKKLKALNFDIVKEIPVVKDSCNQWLIVAKNLEDKDE